LAQVYVCVHLLCQQEDDDDNAYEEQAGKKVRERRKR